MPAYSNDPMRCHRLAAIIALLIANTTGLTAAGRDPAPLAAPATALAEAFIENLGQWPADAKYVGRIGAIVVRAERGRFLLQRVVPAGDGRLLGELIIVNLRGELSNREPIEMGNPLSGTCNYLVGVDRSRWRTGARRYANITYTGPSGQRVVLGSRQGRMLISVEASSATPVQDLTSLEVVGAGTLVQGRDGSLLGCSSLGRFALTKATRHGGVEGTSSVHLGQANHIVLDDSESDVVADLQLEWSTYLGGALKGEYVHEVRVDADGTVVAAGETRSPDFPTTPGVFDPTYSGGDGSTPHDAWVSRLSTDGSTLVFSTFLGGTDNESVESLALSSRGGILIAGSTTSEDFPSTPGTLKPVSIGGDGFICELTEDGTDLAFSTFLGGDTSGDVLNDMDVLDDDSIVVTGWTVSSDFPVTANAYDSTFAGPTNAPDAFLAVLDANGATLKYGTYLGGLVDDVAEAVAVRNDGLIAVAGKAAPDFPVTSGGFDITPPVVGERKGFVSLVDPGSGQLVWSTFIGGGEPRRMRSHQDGSLVIAGVTKHTDTGNPPLPVTASAYDTSYAGNDDGFVMRLEADGTALVYSTFFGGTSIERIYDLALDSAGRPTVAGETQSSSLPTTPGAFLTSPPVIGGVDMFVARFDDTGSQLLYSTFWGGPASDGSFDVALALDSELAVTIGGASGGLFPVTAGAYDPGEPIIFDATLARLTLLPDGAVKYGHSTPGGVGPLAIGVTQMPAVGAQGFALTCVSAPPDAMGWLVLGLEPARPAITVKGAGLWLEPSQIVILLPAFSNKAGYAVVPAPVPPAPQLAGARTWWQFLWKPALGSGAWTASNALEVTFQP